MMNIEGSEEVEQQVAELERRCDDAIGSSGSSGKVGNTNRLSPSVHWCFTLNSYTEDDIKRILEYGSNGSKKYVFQEEIGENGNKHLQGYIAFSKKVRPCGLFTFKAHWEKTRSKEHSIAYCSDPSKRLQGGRIWVKAIHLPEQVKVISKLYPWQAEVVQIILDTSDDDRSIYWIMEKSGNVGKSALVKYLCVKHHALVLSGKGADMKYGIMKFFEKNGTYPKLILCDIPRSIKDYISWSGIEEVKNGCFFSSKYECGMAVFNSPMVVCMANFSPDYNKLSLDRWKVGEILKKEDKVYWKRGCARHDRP